MKITPSNKYFAISFRLLILFILILAVSGCAATNVIKAPIGPQDIHDKTRYSHIQVFYGTDRGYTENPKEGLVYTTNRSNTLEYGTCDVYVPITIDSMKVYYPTVWRLDFVEDPSHLMQVSDLIRIKKDDFFSTLSAEIGKNKEKKAFVFIHGFNTTFDEAAKRTAQIANHLGGGVVPIFYSWPSMGQLWGYLADEDSVEWTKPHLKKFLDEIASYSGAKTIYILAHSMGNRALSKALYDNKINNKTLLSSSYSSIMMAAADIDQDIFKRDIVPVLKLTGASVTIYASSNDNALKASRSLHNDKRVGEIENDIPVIIDGMETIDVSAIDSSLTGHGYYFNNSGFLNDLAEIIRSGKNADLRPNLQPATYDTKRYWKLMDGK